MKKLLFISHDTSRTGAPMVLLHLLRWITLHKKNIVVEVLALEGGSLEKEFKQVAHRYYNSSQLRESITMKFFNRLYGYLKISHSITKQKKIINRLRKNNYDLVYANTIVSVPIGVELIKKTKNSVLISHIHELNAIINYNLPKFSQYLKFIDHFVVPSGVVKKNLVEHWQVDTSNVTLAYAFSHIVKSDGDKKTSKSFVVGASGLVHWRKGYDIFIQVARYLKTHHKEIHANFVWVGKVPKLEQAILNEDLRKLELEGDVKFTGEVINVNEHFSNFDVFLMTSREDPFPLVCIEVGLFGKPIICFKDATGTEEILEKGGGFVVPYLSIEAMAERIIYYYNNPLIKKSHGDINKEAFSEFTPEVICPQIFETIKNHL